MTNILDKLRGGDLRSIGNADEVAQEIVNNPEQFKLVFNGLYDDEPVVRMRSADVVEKATKDRPELLTGYFSKVISILAVAEQQEVCWHMAQISPRLDLTKSEERRIVGLLKKLLSHKSKIVRVSAMDALASFAERNETILKEVIEIIKAQMESGSPSIISRGRKLLQRLERKKTNV
jgi:HEAT repeat protein